MTESAIICTAIAARSRPTIRLSSKIPERPSTRFTSLAYLHHEVDQLENNSKCTGNGPAFTSRRGVLDEHDRCNDRTRTGKERGA